ncbi:MAG: stage III sporulation protein AF [Caulobacteraceae bacterium]
MVDFLRTWILNITIIIVFVMLLETVMPNSSMKRYINVVIGLLIIVVVVKPFVLVKEYADSFNAEVAETAKYIEQDRIADKSNEIDRYQKMKALELFEGNIKTQVLKLVDYISPERSSNARVEVEIDKDFESDTFGNIKLLVVTINRKSSEVIQVDKIKIGGSGNVNENKNVINGDKGEYNLNDRKLCNEIRGGISKALGVSESNVIVKVQQ